MERAKLKSTIEAILFACGTPVEAERIAQALEISTDYAADVCEELIREYADEERGIRIVRLSKSYQMCTREEYAEPIRTVMDIKRNSPLSQAAAEVLAVIAYNQPVTKAFVEQVRGVDCSGVISGLISRQLIEEKGRLELPGRPLVYGTTEHFLRCFNISSIEELPPLPDDSEDESAPAEKDAMTLDDYISAQENEEGTTEQGEQK
ncbi:MAG: SMC-Scp complex subunit ScpB [Clostridia bacterium]|nr:SMC-Scp complex subunit ScpB [Clostridia bacterium]